MPVRRLAGRNSYKKNRTTGRSFHLVVAINDEKDLLWVITVYQPNKNEW